MIVSILYCCIYQGILKGKSMLHKYFSLFLIVFTMSYVNAEDTTKQQNIHNTQTNKDGHTTISADKDSTENKHTAEKKKIILTVDELQNILDKFTAEDKKTMKGIQDQITSWPENVFTEIRAYREFVISSRKKAEEKYKTLSEEAKEAINIEKDLKSKLSPEALKTLNEVGLQQ